jgi:hypothetical protein
MGKQRPCLAGLLAATGALALYLFRLRPWMYTWGAVDDEIAAALPGDELVGAGVARTTRALTIDAPLRMVWPWLAQIGEDRGGFYSYSLLERAAGAHVSNAKTIHPEWQHLRVGDTVWLARRYGDAARQVVAAIEPESHLVLVSPDDFERVNRGEKASGAWGFHLRRDGEWTRILARDSGGAVGHVVFDIAHFVMERKMLLGIRHRAQHAYQDEISTYVRRRSGHPRRPQTLVDLPLTGQVSTGARQ